VDGLLETTADDGRQLLDQFKFHSLTVERKKLRGLLSQQGKHHREH